MPTVDMFDGTKPRKPARIMAHMNDCGSEGAEFICKKCGWNSGWVIKKFTYSEILRGIPCEKCN